MIRLPNTARCYAGSTWSNGQYCGEKVGVLTSAVARRAAVGDARAVSTTGEPTKHAITAPTSATGAILGPLRLSYPRLIWAAGVLAVLAVCATALLLTRAGGDRPPPAVFDVPGHPTGVATVAGEVWVAAPRSGRVWVIDADSGWNVGAPVRTGGTPARLAVGPNGVWVADTARGAVIPVQRRPTRVFRELVLGADVADVALAAGAVWTASSAEDMVRAVEPRGRRVVDLRVGDNPVAIAAGERWLAVAGASDGTLTRIDARERRVVGSRVQVGGVPVAVAVAGETAWVADARGGAVLRVDLARGAREGPAIAVGDRPVAIAVDGDDVYVLCRDDRSLVHVDGASGEVRSRRTVGADPTALALDASHVWVAGGGEDTVMRFDR